MSEFPVWLHHPGFRPAVVAQGMAGERTPSQPIRFPPVLVYNRDNFEEYLAKGYAPGPAAPAPAPVVRHEPMYRGRENIRARDKNEDFMPPPPPSDYPRWVCGEIAKNAIEEREIEERAALARPPEPDPHSAERAEPLAELASLREELAELKKLLLAKAAPPPLLPRRGGYRVGNPREIAAEKRELIKLAQEIGINASQRWTLSQIKDALELATSPNKENATNEDGTS
jgi:hypothetical protein